MRRPVLIFLVFMTVLLLAVSVAISTLWKLIGWLTIPVLLVALVVAGFVLKKLAVKAFEKLLSTPFRMKGAALKNARVDVHEVSTLSEREGKRQIRVDATITPDADSQQQFRAFAPGEITLVPFGTTDVEHYDSEEDGFEISRVEYFEDGEFREFEGEMGQGPMRLRFEADVPLDARRLSFCYYFEVIGDLKIEMQRLSSTA